MRVLARSRRARRALAASLIVVVVLAGSAYGTNLLLNARTVQLFGGVTARVETPHRVVALTFDDGPDPAGAETLLDTLARSEARATFYVTGRELAENPALGARIAAEGHELGNHTYSHRRMVMVSPGTVADEIERTDVLIRRTGYRGEITFRPPNGKKLFSLPAYLDRHDRKTIMWDVEPDSYPEVAASAAGIVSHTVERVRPGSIVLLHGMYSSREQTRLAVGPLIERLRAEGYRFVTVSELLALR
ncbi:polysaccharide deacetylase family protein [Prauserella cavernicola]|uniref:Polysaccharide deacetylase family protein n=1 Tax=Prauserella cavernicola TaxID=2800127 RepID=A0A934QY61_9PSEU|nr:polysaccharide deacetylase family protein [Prauserella cavernicola]MBK1788671.1 polysaccharide deacetylase family protein [Prauserella cavernicola]